MSPARSWWPGLMLSGLLVYLYYPVIADLVTRWSLDAANVGYGVLIPPVAAYLVWDRRRELRLAKDDWSWGGYVLLLVGVLSLILGRAGGVSFVAQASLIAVLFGLTMFLGGVQRTRLLAFPLLFLALMIPPPALIFYRLTWPLQMFTARFATEALRLAGYPVLLQGIYIDLPNARLEVAVACSGLRSLVALAATGILLAFHTQSRQSARTILIASVLPIAILSNAIRVAANVVLGIRDGAYHTFAGWVAFVVATVCLLGVTVLLDRRSMRHAPS